MRAFPVTLPSGARYWTVIDDDLPAAERGAADEAVAVARRHRAVMLGMPRLPAPGGPYPAGQEEPA